MYIGRIMHTNLITVSPKATLVEARELIEKWAIDHLLVVDNKGKLVGIISDRDLKQYWASPANTLSTHELGYLLEKILSNVLSNAIKYPEDGTEVKIKLEQQGEEIKILFE